MTWMIATGKGERGGNRSEYQFRAKVTVDPEPNGSSVTMLIKV
jgi:hypothetical protein